MLQGYRFCCFSVIKGKPTGAPTLIRIKQLFCKRAEKNSELNQTSKMEHLEKIVRRFKDINYLRNKLHHSCLIGFENTSEEYFSRKQFAKKANLQ